MPDTTTSGPLSIATHLETLAHNLDRVMREKGLSESALARASGLSRRTVGNFLRPANRESKRGTSMSFPSGTLANLFKLAAALGYEPWELLAEDTTARSRFLAAVEQAYLDRRQAELDQSAAQARLQRKHRAPKAPRA